MLILNNEHYHTIPFPGAAHKVLAMGVCVQEMAPLRLPIQLTSKNLSSKKRLKIEQQFLILQNGGLFSQPNVMRIEKKLFIYQVFVVISKL